MKTPKTNLYSRLALLTSVILVVGYFVVYAAYQTFQAEEYQSGAALSSTFLGKIVSNLDEINGKISNFTFNAGNVGIGTTTPGAKLEVVGKAYIGGYSIGNGGGDYPAHGYNLDWSAATNSVTGVKYRLSDSATAIREQGNFQFFTAPAGTAGNVMTLTERMRIESNGNVGIGTSAPSMKLEVNGGSLMVKDHTTTNPSIYLDISPSVGVRIYATYNVACTTVNSLGQQIGSVSSGRYLCWAPY